jgi:drug/metabolite transporter (DMT)-like permease
MKKHFSIICMLLAAALWGFAFSAQKNLTEVPPLTVIWSRNILATVFLFALIAPLDKIRKTGRTLFKKGMLPDFNRRELIGGAVCGVVLGVASAFQQYGIADGTDAGKSSFITALYVVIVPIIGLFLRKKPSLNTIIGIALAVVGFYLLCINEAFTIAPSDLLVLVCAFIFALHIIVIDAFGEGTDGVRLSCVQFFVAFIVTLTVSLFTEGIGSTAAVFASTGALLSVVYLGIMSSGVAYTLQIVGQKGFDPSIASIILSLESVFGAIGGAIVHGEVMSPKEYIGCMVVFSAVIISQFDFSKILKKGKECK